MNTKTLKVEYQLSGRVATFRATFATENKEFSAGRDKISTTCIKESGKTGADRVDSVDNIGDVTSKSEGFVL